MYTTLINITGLGWVTGVSLNKENLKNSYKQEEYFLLSNSQNFYTPLINITWLGWIGLVFVGWDWVRLGWVRLGRVWFGWIGLGYVRLSCVELGFGATAKQRKSQEFIVVNEKKY